MVNRGATWVMVSVANAATAVTGFARSAEARNAKVTDREIRVDLAADVLFYFDKFTLGPEAGKTLKEVGQVVSNYPDAPPFDRGPH
jgi:outer membrane protein OmpA-like peptidoglycan-associated protein